MSNLDLVTIDPNTNVEPNKVDDDIVETEDTLFNQYRDDINELENLAILADESNNAEEAKNHLLEYYAMTLDLVADLKEMLLRLRKQHHIKLSDVKKYILDNTPSDSEGSDEAEAEIEKQPVISEYKPKPTKKKPSAVKKPIDKLSTSVKKPVTKRK